MLFDGTVPFGSCASGSLGCIGACTGGCGETWVCVARECWTSVFKRRFLAQFLVAVLIDTHAGRLVAVLIDTHAGRLSKGWAIPKPFRVVEFGTVHGARRSARSRYPRFLAAIARGIVGYETLCADVPVGRAHVSGAALPGA